MPKNTSRPTSQVADMQDLTSQFAPYRAPDAIVPEAQRAQYDMCFKQTSATISSLITSYNDVSAPWLSEGLGFPGYVYLGVMAQRAEFRRPCEVIAREATRAWIKLRYKSDPTPQNASAAGHDAQEDVSQQKLDQLNNEINRLNLRRVCYQQIINALLFGIGHIYIDCIAAQGEINASLPFDQTPQGLAKSHLKRVKVLDPIWCASAMNTTFDPLHDDLAGPEHWFVAGRSVHADRLITMIPFAVPDILKPAYNFGGLSLTQQLGPAVNKFLRMQKSISNVASSFSKLVLLTDMAGAMQTPKSMSIPTQIAQNQTASQDTIIADKNSEDVKIVATPLNNLSNLHSQALEDMAAIASVPPIKYFGFTPSGSNAATDEEIRAFYKEIGAFQEAHLRPVLEQFLRIIQLYLWGEIDPRVSFTFASLL